MIYICERRIKRMEVAAKGGMTVTVKRRTCRLGDTLDGNFFAVQFSFSIMEMVHFLLGSQVRGYMFCWVVCFCTRRRALGGYLLLLIPHRAFICSPLRIRLVIIVHQYEKCDMFFALNVPCSL